MSWFNNAEVDYLIKQVTNLTERVQKLEADARYVADQPQYQSFFSFSQYNYDWNVVPLNSVVKAIVKHLDMQIENVPAQTINNPQEVKVVEKKPSVTITGTDGLGTTWANVAPMPAPKPKRKYTKRKTK